MVNSKSSTSVNLIILAVVIAVGVSVFPGRVRGTLTANYYSSSCPNLTNIVKAKVQTVAANEPRMCASLLRLHFHDCFVHQGCDASILLNDTSGEQFALPNVNSVRGYDVVNDIKAAVEAQCPGIVSCADLLALIAKDCVVELQGDPWTVLFGRKDSFTFNQTSANNDLPPFFLNITQLIQVFVAKGFTITDLVALSGSHTIGKAHCSSFKDRLYGPALGSGWDCIYPPFNTTLQGQCPSTGGDTNLSPLDVQTENTFDNNYFINLLHCQGLLFSDETLAYGGNLTTYNLVHTYATNQTQFFLDFGAAMIKMGNLGPAPTGEVRLKCWKNN